VPAARLIAALALAALAAGCARPVAPPAATAEREPAPPAASGPAIFEPESSPPAPPPGTLVQGVPFVPWREAARLWFRERDRANPSSHAAFLMVLGYWGQHWTLNENPQAMREWGVSEALQPEGLDALKPLLASGIPVIVATALTPVAHPASREAVVSAGAGAPAVGVLGALAPLERLRARGADRWEPIFAAFRVLIGYDDARREVIVHDPSFGPARPVGYGDFDRMWAVTGRAAIVMHPHDPEPAVAARVGSPPYRARTADEEAAEAIVEAHVLAAAGALDEAQRRVQAVLRADGLERGHEHLLRLELATHLARRGDLHASLREAERAAWLAPEHDRAWTLLAEAYRRLGRVEEAEAAGRRAERLGECAETMAAAGDGARPLPAAAYLPSQRSLAERIALSFFVAQACPGSSVTWLLRPLP